MDSEITEDEAFRIYVKEQSDTAGFYANEVDLQGLVGLYRVAFERGRASVVA